MKKIIAILLVMAPLVGFTQTDLDAIMMEKMASALGRRTPMAVGKTIGRAL